MARQSRTQKRQGQQNAQQGQDESQKDDSGGGDDPAPANDPEPGEVAEARVLVDCTISGQRYHANDLVVADAATVASAESAGEVDTHAAAVARAKELAREREE